MNNQTLAIYDNDLIWAIADTIHSYLPNSSKESFAKQFQRTKAKGRSIKATLIWADIASWFLTDSTYGVIHYYPEASKEIEKVASLFKKFQNGEDISESQWELAAEEAREVAMVSEGSQTEKTYQKVKAAMSACIAALSMMPKQQQESLRSFGEAVTDQYTALTAARDAAFEAGGSERSGQAAIARAR